MEERKEKNFEFTLKLNDHIVVQRLFNVFGYNEKAPNSMDFKYVIDDNILSILATDILFVLSNSFIANILPSGNLLSQRNKYS